MRRDVILGAIGIGIVSACVAFLAPRLRPPPPAKKVYETPILIDPLPKFYAEEAPVEVPVFDWTATIDTRAPHEKRGFGSDSARNTDDTTTDDYMNLPLIGTGKTYENENAYMDLEEESSVVEPTVKRFKYIRLTVLQVRQGDAVDLEGVRFFQGRSMNYHTDVTIWNPYTGEKEVYNEGHWSDNDTRSIIFCFKDLVTVYRYELKTSKYSQEYDPIRWKIEGSTNGTYWYPMDDRSDANVPFPVQRDIWIMYRMNKV